ncbi:uncharacterized protein LOC128873233 [Hylaeus volcanicus]|uniref:uncharacterized protein LOC128873233 n=1 Tax=Hylaeus volcanicus TaxID=313075 RepID=UPI0023B79755|nr:uncharacterized protein LOC128873233 [Hylaeus volcanicus]
MAPRMQKVYHSTKEPNRCTLRSTKWVETAPPRTYDAVASRINRKKEFLRCMGLQMKTFRCKYSTFDGNHTNGRFNTPDGVKLRDCSVVILGAPCKTCGKCFKCVTDVNSHMVKRHGLYHEARIIASNETLCSDEDNDCIILLDPCELPIVAGSKDPVKLQRKLRVTLKIGHEVVSKLFVKRKYLKTNRVDTATQTDHLAPTEFVAEENVDESGVSHIDQPVFDNSFYKCCSQTMRVVTDKNRYLAGNIVASTETECGESAAQMGTTILDRLTKSCAITSDESSAIRDIPSKVVTFEPDVTCIYKQRKPSSRDAISDTNRDSNQRHTTDSIVFEDTSDDSAHESYLNPILMSCNVDGIRRSTIAQSCQMDMNGNERHTDVATAMKQMDIVKMIKVIMPPIIVPIIAPQSITSTVNLRSSRQQHPRHANERNSSDDEVQEVLRIVRGRDSAEQINHESPNRLEQELLVHNAVTDMIRRQDWVVEKDEQLTKKRKRVAKTDVKSITHDAPTKKRSRDQPNSKNNIVTNATGDGYHSNSKKPFANAEKSRDDVLCISDSVKENMINCNKINNLSSEMLKHYGITYCNEGHEINNNTETMQESVSLYAGDDRSDKPTVIDLVNDNDE